MWYFGVDCGGTKSVACLGIRTGNRLLVQVRARRSGSANPSDVGPEKAAQRVAAIFQTVCRKHGAAPTELQACCFAMAGAGRAQSRWAVYKCLPTELQHVPCYFVHDGWAALSAACSPPVGIAVIAGTGSLVFGRRSDGRSVRVGGWGSLVGDDGSAFAIGRKALNAAACMVDGRGQTRLLHAVLEASGSQSWDELIARLYRTPFDRRFVAQLAPIVVQEAARDSEANRIITEAIGDLVNMVITAVNRLEVSATQIPLVTAGGLLIRSAKFRKALMHSLANAGYRFAELRLAPFPAEGAAALAAFAERWLQPDELCSIRAAPPDERIAAPS